MKILEQYTEGKSTSTPSEDAVEVTASYVAVIDGATPKTDFLYPGGETPGHLAARLLCEAIRKLPADLSAEDCVAILTKALHQEHVAPSDRPIASLVIYSVPRREVWMIGDCLFGYVDEKQNFQTVTNTKYIDKVLSEWRRDIIQSYLSRGIMTQKEIAANDPGRRIIQPIITKQVRYQNAETRNPFNYAMLDGEPMPTHFIKVFPISEYVHTLVLATDGYPVLMPNLKDSEQALHQLLLEDPLCIGPLLGTKGMRPGNKSFDDRTYLKLEI
jgi:glycerophosphoryl diester phosphodiesterase